MPNFLAFIVIFIVIANGLKNHKHENRTEER